MNRMLKYLIMCFSIFPLRHEGVLTLQQVKQEKVLKSEIFNCAEIKQRIANSKLNVDTNIIRSIELADTLPLRPYYSKYADLHLELSLDKDGKKTLMFFEFGTKLEMILFTKELKSGKYKISLNSKALYGINGGFFVLIQDDTCKKVGLMVK